jgi:hypothetical protein
MELTSLDGRYHILSAMRSFNAFFLVVNGAESLDDVMLVNRIRS